jgi:NADP-reducing hydrogenase subunit HndB
MSRIGAEDLKKIKDRVTEENSLRDTGYTVQVTVHLGTCGIASGGDQVLESLKEQIQKSKRKDIKVVISGCMGMCSSEPNVTVRRMGEEAVLYRDLNPEKMVEIFQGHIMKGDIQSEYALAKIP